ncbi:MAG: hypothetical protein AB4062_07625 [Crocosphaera sp.]
MTKFDDKLTHLNEKLKIASIPLTIEQRGSKLCIRGVFPPKPGSSIDRPHQQRLSLHLPATIEGLKAAEAKAKEISGQLVFDKFNWEHYVPNINNTNILIGDAISLFEKFYFSRRERNENRSSPFKVLILQPYFGLKF